ncbi:cation diffusion facilitator family transporter [Hymenobacter roseosalivarius DSM 11622]|uniref:Cation diffusion facilitator family transporter n=1 Tax=Hymenobacter roseosalivarius DSM 11622 TaxID=645990 RepID=A0A1W1UXN2_9BACT|nr:cation diffusion facilitator family transporter [Hymenobacter roseosalivarius]SMB85521.1 cation diffusion facilitator family transporter [Hymenobacter roseosalivarius DSM 11622]
MAHNHSHDHQHGPADGNYGRAFALGIALNLAFVAIEAAGGLWANSSALLSDAGHNLSDVLSLALAWGATRLARQPASERYTYGLKSATIQAALLNAALLYAALGIILWDAIDHLLHPTPVDGRIVMLLAGIGILINGFTAWLFRSGQQGDVNVRGAYLHMLTDALVSAGVVVGGGLVLWTGWLRLDALISFGILGLIAYSSWGLLRETVQLSLQAVPPGIDIAAVRQFLLARPGVTQVHDLHVWPLSTRDTALTAHLVRPGGADNAFLQALQAALQAEFSISHCTVQVEDTVPVAGGHGGCEE